MSDFITQIIDFTNLGSGIGLAPDGRKVFVPFTHPGDTVKVRLVKVEKKFAQGEMLELVQASSDRIKPRCQYFGKCGGCELQHVDYLTQWQIKLNFIRTSLKRRQVNFEHLTWDEFPAPKTYGFRNRIHLKIRDAQLGYFSKGSHRLVPIERCEIAEEPINEFIQQQQKPDKLKSWSSYEQVEFENTKQNQVIAHWNQPPASRGFRQVYDEQNHCLQNWVCENLKTQNVLLDLYGGSSNLSSLLLERFQKIHCVDTHIGQTPNAKIKFHVAAVELWLQSQNMHADAAILDPPRAGLADAQLVAKALKKMGVSEVLLIGCDPVSWARDVAEFTQNGWKLEKLGALDFFPQTHHVEALTKLVTDR